MAVGVELQRIPRILHRVFLSGQQAFEELRSRNDSAIRPEWTDHCRMLHTEAGWDFRFWDEAAALQLVKQVSCFGGSFFSSH